MVKRNTKTRMIFKNNQTMCTQGLIQFLRMQYRDCLRKVSYGSFSWNLMNNPRYPPIIGCTDPLYGLTTNTHKNHYKSEDWRMKGASLVESLFWMKSPIGCWFSSLFILFLLILFCVSCGSLVDSTVQSIKRNGKTPKIWISQVFLSFHFQSLFCFPFKKKYFCLQF